MNSIPEHTIVNIDDELPDSRISDPVSRFSLARVVCSLSALVVLTKLFGFAEKIAIAHFFGTSHAADIYFAVTAIVLSLVFLLKELIYPTMLPVLARSLAVHAQAGIYLFRKVFLGLTLLLVILILGILIFAPNIVAIAVPGFSASQQQLAVQVLRWLMPALLFLGMGVVTYTTLNAHRRFLVSAVGELSIKVCLLVFLFMLVPTYGLIGIAMAMALGSFVCLLIHLSRISEWRELSQATEKHWPLLREMLTLMTPLMVGVVCSHISGIIDNLLASTLATGSIACLNYAKRISDAILLIGPVAIVTVVYAQAAHLAGTSKRQELAALLKKVLRVLFYLAIPTSCILLQLRQPLLSILLQHGQFDQQSTFGTSQALAVYALGLTTFSLESLLVYSFFALSDTKTPVLLGVICVGIDIGLAILFLQPFAHLGIAMALVISKTIKVALLLCILQRRIKSVLDKSILIFLLKLFAASLGLILTVYWLKMLSFSFGCRFITLSCQLLMPLLAGVFAFVAISHLIKIEEYSYVVGLLRRKIARAKR